MRVAIIGASNDRSKYGNKAVRAYKSQGHDVFPINPHEALIEGLQCYQTVLDVPGELDMASFYVPVKTGESLAEEIINKKISVVYLNPGSESDTLVRRLKEGGVQVRLACSILALGVTPSEL